MKDKTITVRVPDFCPEDCPELEIHEEACEFRTIGDGLVYERAIHYSCEREGDCRRLYEQLKTRYCADCRDAMKARGGDMINEMTLAPVLADLRDEYKASGGDYMRGYADGIDRALNLLMMWQYRPDSKPEAIPRGLMDRVRDEAYAGMENRPTQP